MVASEEVVLRPAKGSGQGLIVSEMGVPTRPQSSHLVEAGYGAPSTAGLWSGSCSAATKPGVAASPAGQA